MEIFEIERFARDGVLEEESFRRALDQFDWTKYNGREVLIKGCAEILIPTWAYVVVAARLANHAKKVYYGEVQKPIPVYERGNGSRPAATPSTTITRPSGPVRVTFQPANKVVTGQAGQTILEIATDNDIVLEYECGGNCQCTTCHVIIEQGLEQLSVKEDSEVDMLASAEGLTEKSRLGCQARVYGDIVAVIPERDPFKLDSLLKEMGVDPKDLPPL